jgi:hypothetical protein
MQSREHIGEPGLRIDIVEFGAHNQRVDVGGASATLIGAGEGPSRDSYTSLGKGCIGAAINVVLSDGEHHAD